MRRRAVVGREVLCNATAASEGEAMTAFTINGSPHAFDGDPEMPLLWYLRDVAGMTGTKFGCGQALCGACTVHLDGTAVRSCQTFMDDIDGQAVVTVEGLSPDGMHPVQKALARAQRRPVRLLPGRADHAGGLAAARTRRTRPTPRSIPR